MAEDKDVLKKLETIVEKLENLSVQQQTADPKRQKVVDELITEARGAIEEVVHWQRRQENGAQLSAFLKAIDRNTATFLKAIDANTAKTNKLLTLSEERLRQIETELSEPDETLFEVDPRILEEGAFLKAQLAGVEGTEGPGPLFKDAPTVEQPTGLDVLATAVNNAGQYQMHTTV